MAKYEVADLVRDDAKKSEGAVVSTSPAGPGLTNVVILLAASILPISYILRDEEDPPGTKNMTKARLDLDPHEVETRQLSTMGKALDSTLDKNYDRLTQKLKTGGYPSIIARCDDDQLADLLSALCAEDLGVNPDSFSVLSITEQRAKLEQIYNLRNAIARDYHLDLSERYNKTIPARLLGKNIDATKILDDVPHSNFEKVQARVEKLGTAGVAQGSDGGLRPFYRMDGLGKWRQNTVRVGDPVSRVIIPLPENPKIPTVYGASEKWVPIGRKGRRTHGVYYDGAPQPIAPEGLQLPRYESPIEGASAYSSIPLREGEKIPWQYDNVSSDNWGRITVHPSTQYSVGTDSSLELSALGKKYQRRRDVRRRLRGGEKTINHLGLWGRQDGVSPIDLTPRNNDPIFVREAGKYRGRLDEVKSIALKEADWDLLKGHARVYQEAGRDVNVLAEIYFDEQGNPYRGKSWRPDLINPSGRGGRKPQILSAAGAVDNWVEDASLRPQDIDQDLYRRTVGARRASNTSSALVDLWSGGHLEFTSNSELLGGQGTYNLSPASAKFISSELGDHTRGLYKQKAAISKRIDDLSTRWRENFNLISSTELSDETMLINGKPVQLSRREVAFRNLLQLQEEAAAAGSSSLFSRLQEGFGSLSSRKLEGLIESSARYRLKRGEVSNSIIQHANEALKLGDVDTAISLGVGSKANTDAIQRMVRAFKENPGLGDYIGAGYGSASQGRRVLGRIEAIITSKDFADAIDRDEVYRNFGGDALDTSIDNTYQLRSHLRSNFQAGPNEKNVWEANIAGDSVDDIRQAAEAAERDAKIGSLTLRENIAKRSAKRQTFHPSSITGFSLVGSLDGPAPLSQDLESALKATITIGNDRVNVGDLAAAIAGGESTVQGVTKVRGVTIPAASRSSIRRILETKTDELHGIGDLQYNVALAIHSANVADSSPGRSLASVLASAEDFLKKDAVDAEGYASLIVQELQAVEGKFDASSSPRLKKHLQTKVLSDFQKRMSHEVGLYERALGIVENTIPQSMVSSLDDVLWEDEDSEKFLTVEDTISGFGSTEGEALHNVELLEKGGMGPKQRLWDRYLIQAEKIGAQSTNPKSQTVDALRYLISKGVDSDEAISVILGGVSSSGSGMDRDSITQFASRWRLDRSLEKQQTAPEPRYGRRTVIESGSEDFRSLQRALVDPEYAASIGLDVNDLVIDTENGPISREAARLEILRGNKIGVSAEAGAVGKIDYYLGKGKFTALPAEGQRFSAFDIETNILSSEIDSSTRPFVTEVASSRGYGSIGSGTPKVYGRGIRGERAMLTEFTGDLSGYGVLLGHNIREYDIPEVSLRTGYLLDKAVSGNSDGLIQRALDLENKSVIDTLEIAQGRRSAGAPASLQMTAYMLGIDRGSAHTAADDVRTNLDVFKAFAKDKGKLLKPGQTLAGNGDVVQYLGQAENGDLDFLGISGDVEGAFRKEAKDAAEYLSGMEQIPRGKIRVTKRQQAAIFLQNQIEALTSADAQEFVGQFSQSYPAANVTPTSGVSKATRLAEAMRTVGLEPEQHARFLLELSKQTDPALKRAISAEYFTRLAAFSTEATTGSSFNLNVQGIIPRHERVTVGQNLNDLVDTIWADALAERDNRNIALSEDMILSKEFNVWQASVDRLRDELALDPTNPQLQIRLAELEKNRPGGGSGLFNFIERTQAKASALEESFLQFGGASSLEEIASGRGGAKGLLEGKKSAENTRRWFLGAAVYSELSDTELTIPTDWGKALTEGIVNTDDQRRLGTNYKGLTHEVVASIEHQALSMGDPDRAGARLVGNTLSSYERQGVLRLQLSKALGEEHPFDQAAALDLSRPTPVGELPEEAAAIAEKLRKEEMRGSALRNQMLGAIDNDSALMKSIRLDDLALDAPPKFSTNVVDGENRLTAGSQKLSEMEAWKNRATASNPQSSYLGAAAADALGGSNLGMDTEFLGSAANVASKEARALKNAHLIDDLPLLSRSVKVAGLALGAGLGLMAAVGMLMPRKDQPGPDPGPNSTVVGPSLAEAPPIGILNQNVNVEMYDRHGKDISHIKNALRGFSTGEPDVRIADRSMGLRKEDVEEIIKNHANAI